MVLLDAEERVKLAKEFKKIMQNFPAIDKAIRDSRPDYEQIAKQFPKKVSRKCPPSHGQFIEVYVPKNYLLNTLSYRLKDNCL